MIQLKQLQLMHLRQRQIKRIGLRCPELCRLLIIEGQCPVVSFPASRWNTSLLLLQLFVIADTISKNDIDVANYTLILSFSSGDEFTEFILL